MSRSLTPQVQKTLLNFIEVLGHYDYFTLPQGDIIINFVIKLSESDSSVSRGQAGRVPRVGARKGQSWEQKEKRKRAWLTCGTGLWPLKACAREAMNQDT